MTLCSCTDFTLNILEKTYNPARLCSCFNFYPALNLKYLSLRKKMKGFQAHGLIHRTNEIKLLNGGKTKQNKQINPHIKSIGKFPLKGLISRFDPHANLTGWRRFSHRCWLSLKTWIQLGQKGTSYREAKSIIQTKQEHKVFLQIASGVKGTSCCYVRGWFGH